MFDNTRSNDTGNREKYIRTKIVKEFFHYKSGIIGLSILCFLILLTLYTFIFIPFSSFQQWNNVNYWIDNPKMAPPVWTNNIFVNDTVPKHIILESSKHANISQMIEGGIKKITHEYNVDFRYNVFPSDLMFVYLINSSKTDSIIEIFVQRPDNQIINLYFHPITFSLMGEKENLINGRVFSTDRFLLQDLKYSLNNSNDFSNNIDPKRAIFSKDDNFSNNNDLDILKGNYKFVINFYMFNYNDSVINSNIILGGKLYGLVGTDEMRRDLAIGLFWGTPIALFIGISVSVVSVLIGLFYGIFSGYKGKFIDEGMMRINDIFYSLPTLPLLILLSLTLGRSIFLIVLFLIFFGWMGTAKISRSMALQIKNLQYIEVSKMMGQSDFKIIFKHIIPQLLPLTFASIAISVPAAILTEAILSFLGLGDPSIPTWGQILHEANSAAAASRGLWWWIIPPGVLITLTGLAFVLIGNTLEKIFDPRSR